MSTLSKVCRRCKIEKPLTDFNRRSGITFPNKPGDYQSECKSCIKERMQSTPRWSRNIPLTIGEQFLIDYLAKSGIYATPGKSVYAADVDVVAWGCVWIEVKHSKYELWGGNEYRFMFKASPVQVKRGFLAQIVVLICDYIDMQTYHFFDAKDPVFYRNDTLKSGLTFVPGLLKPRKVHQGNVVMTQGMMDAAQDQIGMIETYRLKIANSIKRAM